MTKIEHRMTSPSPTPSKIKAMLLPPSATSRLAQGVGAAVMLAIALMWLWAGANKWVLLMQGEATDAPTLYNAVREQLRSTLLRFEPHAFIALLATWETLLGCALLLCSRCKPWAALASVVTITLFTAYVMLASPSVLGEGVTCGCLNIGAFDVQSLTMLAVRNAGIALLSLGVMQAWRTPSDAEARAASPDRD